MIIKGNLRVRSPAGMQGKPNFKIIGWPLSGESVYLSYSRLRHNITNFRVFLHPLTMRSSVFVAILGSLLWCACAIAPAPVAAQTVQEPLAEEAENPLDALTARVQELELQNVKLQNEILKLEDRLNALVGVPDNNDVFIIPAGESPVRGDPDAPVTLIMFGDYQSGYSARAQAVVAQLLQEFPDQLRMVYKHFPLSDRNPQANEAALTAISAQRQDKFWEMHDLLFRNTRRLEPDLYIMLAGRIGLDLNQFQGDRNSLWTLDRLADDEKWAARVGVDSVPAFYLNGRRMTTWRHDYLKEQIKRLLAVFNEE